MPRKTKNRDASSNSNPSTLPVPAHVNDDTNNNNSHNNSNSNGTHPSTLTLPTVKSSSSSSSSSSLRHSRSRSFATITDDVHDDPNEVILSHPTFWSAALCCQSGRGPLSWTGLGIVCSALALISFGLHLLLDLLAEPLEHVGWYSGIGTLAVLLVIIAVPLTHGLVGSRKNGPLYTFFQPFFGGLRFILLQVVAWTLWTLTVLAGIYGVWIGGKKITSGWLSAVGFGGVVSQILVLISLHFFVSNAGAQQNDTVVSMREKAKSLAQKLHHHNRKSHSAASSSREYKQQQQQQQQDKKDDKVTNNRKSLHVDVPVEPDVPVKPSRATEIAAAASTSMWPFSSIAMKLTFLLLATLSLILAVFVESMDKTSPSTRASIQSLLTSAILLAVPITHLLARRSLTHAGYLLFQPFKGGPRFVILQAVAWTLWTLAFVSASISFLVVAFRRDSPKSNEGAVEIETSFLSIPWSWISNMITSAGVGGILSQALVLLSLKYFDLKLSRTIEKTARVINIVRNTELATPSSSRSRSQTPASNRSTPTLPELAIDERAVLDRAVQVLSSPAVLQRVLSSPAHKHSQLVWATSKSSTPIRRGPSPFPSSLGIVSTKAIVKEDATEVEDTHAAPTNEVVVVAPEASPESSPEAESPETSAEPAALTLSRVSMADLLQSLKLAWHFYRQPENWRQMVKEFLLNAQSLSIIFLLYMVPILAAVFTFVPMVLMYLWHPLPWFVYPVYLSLCLLYASTYRNRPSLTGARNWPSFRASRAFWGSFERYFGGQIIAQGKLSEKDGPYIFGFHPHGIYPMTCFWSTRGGQFQDSYPGLQIDICGASVMFHMPLLRELVMWAGGREVSGTSIRLALKEKRSIMLVPGGQREMRHSKADPSKMTLITRHRGFIRMALEHGTPLVPVLSIGETMLLENVHAPHIQAYSLRTIGVGFPIWPYGRWYSPLPNPHPVVVVFGEPIPVPLMKEPTPEAIEQYHTIYYAQLQQMYLTHRHMIPGFENSTLVYSED